MIRGTTPTITVTLDAYANSIDALYLTVSQFGVVVIEKTLSDGEIDGASIKFPLTQADTLLLAQDAMAQIQVRGKVENHAFASGIVEMRVEAILKDGII